MAGSEQAAIMGLSEGGSLATVFAAHYPERCRALVLWGAFAKFSSWFPTSEKLQRFFDYVETDWGAERTSASGCHQRRTIPYFGNGSRNASGRARVPLQS